jgi:hypothetical protein
MNTETGQIYHGEAEIQAARERGEPLVYLSEEEAKSALYGMNRYDRRRARFGSTRREAVNA